MESVPITTKVLCSNPAHGEVYLIQHYMIKFVSYLRQVDVFSGYSVSSTNKTDRHDITQILVLLKVALNTIAITHHDFMDVVNITETANHKSCLLSIDMNKQGMHRRYFQNIL